MNKKKAILRKLEEQGLMPLYYHEDIQVCLQVLDALYQSGVRIVEYTNRGEAALLNFKKMKQVVNEKYPDLFFGAGTIKNKKEAEDFINSGADFIVSPAIVKKVYKVAKRSNILWIPGCMTATEILKAEKWGLRLVKLFPGNLLGPGYLNAIRELFPATKFMPTGGVEASVENIKEWFSAGVFAVGMGSKLISKQITDGQLFAQLMHDSRHALQLISQFKSSGHSS